VIDRDIAGVSLGKPFNCEHMKYSRRASNNYDSAAGAELSIAPGRATVDYKRLRCVSLNRDRRGFFLGAAPFFGRGLPIALLEIRQDDREHELLFPVVIELDDDVLFGAGKHAT
jgi:hypothetical protein